MRLTTKDRLQIIWGIDVAYAYPLVDRDDLQKGSRLRVVLEGSPESEWFAISTNSILNMS